jgi:hypothetical protein
MDEASPENPATTSPDASAPSGVRRHWPLLAVLLAVLALHLAHAVSEPAPTLFEDEPHYNQYAYLDRTEGTTSLLPGRLRFSQRPELISRLWSRLLGPEDLVGLTPDRARHDPRLQRRARWINLPLFLGLLICVYAQARALALSRRAATLAAGLLAASPWFGFYVHTLWAEVLHAFLVSAAFLGVLLYFQSGRLVPLVPAGLALGWALLAKGTLNPFVPVLLVLVALWPASRRSGAPPVALRRRLAAVAALGLSALVVVGPQLLVNARAGHGLRIAGNRWKNLEMGILLEPRERQTPEEREARTTLHRLYADAGLTYEEREAASEERVWGHLERVGLPAVAGGQLRKLVLLLFDTPSFFERALTERWGDPAPLRLRILRWPGRVLWLALLGLGTAGVLMIGWRSPGHVLLALFALFFAAALLVIPYKLRFAMPLVPVLALFSAALLDRLLQPRVRTP